MRDGLSSPIASRAAAVEWPTVILAAVIYGGWLALTWYHAAVPVWLLVPAAAWLIAWHGSLQHEIIHGHPTRSRLVNTALGLPPLALWLPFERYRQTHLTHHHDERLTDPLDDPESRYWTEGDWQRLGAIGRALVKVQGTLPGRLLIGPAWSIGRFLAADGRAIAAGDRQIALIWLRHLLLVAPVLAWVIVACRMPIWLYLTAFVYAGTSLTLIRSFAEHRAHRDVVRRTAIVEGAPVLGLLFLYNNLHAVHHRWPTLAWYKIPGFYARHRQAIVGTGAGGPIYRGYGDIMRRFWRRPHDQTVHPFLDRG